jgi:histidinol-phosphate aminotransferase
MSLYRANLQKMQPYVPGRPIEEVKELYGLSEVVKLASNENPYGCSPRVPEAVTRTFLNTRLYPDGYCTELRKAVSEKYGVLPEQLVFGAGTDEVITMLGKVFINPGDEAVTAEITFSQYAAAVESMGGVMVYSPMRAHGFDLPALLERVTPQTKLIFIANPNNPTGTYTTAQEQQAFIEAVPENVTVVLDEAYQEYAAAENYPSSWDLLKKHKNVILLKTFSKIYGMASLRVGFGAMDAETVAQIEKIRSPFNVTVQGQAAALAALGDPDFVQNSYWENRRVMALTEKWLDEMGLYHIPSQTNFIMADTKRGSRAVFEALMKKGYIIRPGGAFGMDTYIRITIGTEAQMEGFIKALQDVLAEMK